MRNETIKQVAAFAAGAVAMFYLDSLIRQRRVPAVSRRLERAMSRARQNDAQVRQRVVEQLDRLVSHPRAIEVSVTDGIVRVDGQVLAQELDGLLTQLTRVPGVNKVHNALGVLHGPGRLAQTPRRRALA